MLLHNILIMRLLLLFICLLATDVLAAQDFILHGCYWACPMAATDSMDIDGRLKRFEAQLPELAYAGFTWLRLPALTDSLRKEASRLNSALRKSAFEAISEVQAPRQGAVFQNISVAEQPNKGIRITAANGDPDPVAVANFLNARQATNTLPELLVADLAEWQSAAKLAAWVNRVGNNLTQETRDNLSVRVYDNVLREALRQACTNPAFDVRKLYRQSLRDATALTGFNVVTRLNDLSYQNQNAKANDHDDPIADPLLAYAYLLTNNQLGLPEIWYDDYYGSTTQAPLKREIDQLLKIHRQFIANALTIEYLNDFNTNRQGLYLSATEGADAAQTLVFQIDGINTPAGKAANSRSDVLVVINFANVPLRLVQQVNMSNVRIGDVFTDVLGRSAEPFTTVSMDSIYNIPNAVYLELPPRSYSVWVQGSAAAMKPAPFSLQVEAFDTYAELTWEAPAGRNVQDFEIEKSVNSSDFTQIGRVAAVGQDAAGAAYLYIDDERLPQDEVAYRLRAVSATGVVEYSEIQTILPFIREMSFELHDSGQAHRKLVKVRSNFADTATLKLFSASGELVTSRTQPIRRGVTTIFLDLSEWPRGVYILQIATYKNKTWSKRLVNL